MNTEKLKEKLSIAYRAIQCANWSEGSGPYILCFKDIFPKAPVHILIIPKGQFKDIFDFSINATSEEKKAVYDGFAKDNMEVVKR